MTMSKVIVVTLLIFMPAFQEDRERLEIEKARDAENWKKLVESAKDRSGNPKPLWKEIDAGSYKSAVYEDKEGLALFTRFSGALFTRFSFDVAEALDKDGKPIPIERCGACSPEWVRLKGTAPVRVKYKVTRTWYSDHEVKFTRPKNGDLKRVGDFTFTVKWPEVEVSSDRKYAPAVLELIPTNFTFEHESWKPPSAGGGSVHYGGRFPKDTARRATWCTCEGGPKAAKKESVEVVSSFRIACSYAGDEGVELPKTIDGVTSLAFTFRKPIQESIELDVPDLAPSPYLGER